MQGTTPQSGITVTWEVVSGGGGVAPQQTATNAQGIAQTTWTLGLAAGAQSARASASGVTGSPVSFSATAAAPQPQVDITVQNDEFVPNSALLTVGGTASFTYAASARTHDIRPVPPATIPSQPTIMDGPAGPFNFMFNTAGTYRFYCSVHGAPGVGMHGQIVVQ